MARAIDIILEVKRVSSVILSKDRDYEYGPEQVKYLKEIADVLEEILRQKLISLKKFGADKCRRFFSSWNSKLQYIVINLLRKDPIGAYVEILREIRRISIQMKKRDQRRYLSCYRSYKNDVLEVIKDKLEDTQLIKIATPNLAGYHIGDRSLYRQIFMPSVRPNFMPNRYMITPPEKGKAIDRYMVGDTEVQIYKVPGKSNYLYYVLPPEFKLSEKHYAILDAARRYMAAHRPKTAEFVKSDKVREVFYSIGRDMIREMASQSKLLCKPRNWSNWPKY